MDEIATLSAVHNARLAATAGATCDLRLLTHIRKGSFLLLGYLCLIFFAEAAALLVHAAAGELT